MNEKYVVTLGKNAYNTYFSSTGKFKKNVGFKLNCERNFTWKNVIALAREQTVVKAKWQKKAQSINQPV